MSGDMEWLAIAIAIAFLGVVVVWPLTKGRRYFSRDAEEKARDLANQVYAGRPDDGLTALPFDPVARGPLVRDLLDQPPPTEEGKRPNGQV